MLEAWAFGALVQAIGQYLSLICAWQSVLLRITTKFSLHTTYNRPRDWHSSESTPLLDCMEHISVDWPVNYDPEAIESTPQRGRLK